MADTIEDDLLATDLATTEELWQTAYGQPYMKPPPASPKSRLGAGAFVAAALVGTLMLLAAPQLRFDAALGPISLARRQLQSTCDASEYYISNYANTWEVGSSGKEVRVTMDLTYNLVGGPASVRLLHHHLCAPSCGCRFGCVDGRSAWRRTRTTA